MAVVVGSYLDPEGEYFSGYGYRYDERYDDASFWAGQGGALAFEMFRMDQGATTVYVQIATSRRNAVRCGATIGRNCVRQKFLDGNFFNLTNTVNVGQGMEVQHRPTGQHVITVIARNTAEGEEFDIQRGRPHPAGAGPSAAAARDLSREQAHGPFDRLGCMASGGQVDPVLPGVVLGRGRLGSSGSTRSGPPGRSSREGMTASSPIRTTPTTAPMVISSWGMSITKCASRSLCGN